MKRWKKGIAVMLLLTLCCVSVYAEEVNDMSDISQEMDQELDFDHFLEDLMNALSARYENAKNESFTIESSRKKAMELAAKEWETMGKYEAASFKESDDFNNEEYIRQSYLVGLKKQNELNEQMSNDDFWRAWDEGYAIRRNVLVELQHVYSDKVNAETLNQYIELGETENYTGNYTLEAWQLQALVSAYHQREGLDGQPGKITLLKLKQMQAELDIPINGVVNETRIDELVEALEKEDRTDVIEAANTKLETGGVHDEQGNPYENVTIQIVNVSAAIDVLDKTEDVSNMNEIEVQTEMQTEMQTE